MRVSSFARTYLALLAVAMSGLMAAGTAGAQSTVEQHRVRGCTNASLRGTFGFTAQGVTVPTSSVPAPLQGPFASTGVSTFDGRGRLILTATSSFNGIVQGPATVKGTYEVSDDCTYTSQTENGVTFSAVIVDGGDQLLILQTTPGVVITGMARRQMRTH